MKFSPSEERARQQVLKSKPRATQRNRAKRTEEEYAQGKHSAVVRQTFDKARPIIKRIEKNHPQIDRSLILDCLKEQTIMAETWPTAQDRKKASAWKKLCKAWIEFCAATNQTPTLEALKGVQKSLKRQGHTTHDPQYLWVTFYKKWPPFFQDLQAVHHLPAPEAIGNRGRPPNWWSDVQARKLAEHFREKTGNPGWKLVSDLLRSAPQIHGVSMSVEHIRQRLNRWNRDNREALMQRLAGTRER